MKINQRYFRVISRALILSLTFGIFGLVMPLSATAANLTSLQDNQSRLAATTVSDHTIVFVTPTGITSFGQTITINFNSYTTVSSNIVAADVNLATATNGTCGTYSQTKTLSSSPGADIWGVGTSGTTITLTAPSSGTIGTSGIPAGRCVQVKVGTNAGGSHQVTNPSAGQATITINVNGTSTDTGTIGIPIIANDQVSLTATVNPTITFTLSQTSLGFGTLTTANGRWATNGGGAAVSTVGLQLTAATNGASGYTIYNLGDTLKSGANSITALGSSTASSPNSEQFGVNGAVSATGAGSPAVSSPFNTTNQYAWTATASTQVQFASNSAPDSGSTFDVKYLANISPITKAGSYTATHTWTAVGNF